MFPLQLNDELVPNNQQDVNISGHVVSPNMATNVNKIQRRQRRLSFVEDNNNDNNNNDNELKMDSKLKKVMHRDIERQRRQEMANLYASLRSLLPLEYIKGKRSISDHMHMAVNYINHLQKKIKEMHIQKEKLKLSDSGVENKSSIKNRGSLNCVVVNPCQDGVEILINNCSKDESFSLSRVLRGLLEEGFHVVSCISTTEKGRSLHRLQSEVQLIISLGFC